MVHSDDVLSSGATKRVSDSIFKARLAEFSRGMKSYRPPEKEVLERSVEATTTCGKCKAPVRAVLTDARPSETFATDLDILVSLNCTADGCEWTSNQWRTWVRTKPTEL